MTHFTNELPFKITFLFPNDFTFINVRFMTYLWMRKDIVLKYQITDSECNQVK